MTAPIPRSRILLSVGLLLTINLAIVGKLFFVDFSAYTGSIEGTFIALPRLMAKYPGQWRWFPFWNGGLPFESSYLPFSHWMVAAFSLLTHVGPAHSFHIVMAAVYALSPLPVFWLGLEVSRKWAASLFTALAYSCISPSALLIPAIAADVGGALRLRRLHILVFWGESPHTVALALVPVAVVLLSRALTRPEFQWKILAGLATAAVVLSNAFGIVMLALAMLAWLLVYSPRPWWRAPLQAAAIGFVTWCWISCWLSPRMIRAIRENSPTAGGDFRFTLGRWIALAVVLILYVALWLGMRRRAPQYMQFFVLLAFFPVVFVVLWYAWDIPVIFQPARYQLEMDLVLLFPLVFGAAAFIERLGPRGRIAAVGGGSAVIGFFTVYSVVYAAGLIRPVDPATLSERRIAEWLDRNLPGSRAFVAGSTSFLYNVFTDNPQLHGGHDQHTFNPFIPIVDFTIRSGMNAGSRDADYSIFWARAFGVRAIAVSAPGSTDWYQAFANPRKFDGVLPLLWRDRADSIYEVPVRSESLAHVIPAAAVPSRRPTHGLDIAPVEPYVAALEDPRYPPAVFRWNDLADADIGAIVQPGEVISVQITYEKGWEARANGRLLAIRGDAIGQMVIDPDCTGHCEIALRYTGGTEQMVTRSLSVLAVIVTIVLVFKDRSRAVAARKRG